MLRIKDKMKYAFNKNFEEDNINIYKEIIIFRNK